jgi:urease subunit gamma
VARSAALAALARLTGHHPPDPQLVVEGGLAMHLTPREVEKLMVYQLADIALRRKAKGLKLNHPESMAVICAAAMEGAREGKTVEEVMTDAAAVLTRDDVMEGVPEMIPFVQLEAVFTDGSRLVTVHDPVK